MGVYPPSNFMKLVVIGKREFKFEMQELAESRGYTKKEYKLVFNKNDLSGLKGLNYIIHSRPKDYWKIEDYLEKFEFVKIK